MRAHLNMDNANSYTVVESQDYPGSFELAFGDGESIVNITVTKEMLEDIQDSINHRIGE